MSQALAQRRLGLILGLAGVAAFSLSLPMTRLAVSELSPGFVAWARMAGAGLLALLWLAFDRSRRPQRADAGLLAIAAGGVVIGFPLFSTIAMSTLAASHAAIINGALPFATALAAAIVFHDRQSRRFWLCAAAGSALVIGFALRGGGFALASGDLAMLAAVLTCAAGYAAGGRLAQRIGGIATIVWSLVLVLPLSLPLALWFAWQQPPAAGAAAWIGFAYVTLISQFLAFFAWYNGLALGGIARVGQLQLLQIFLTLAAAALFFGETVDPSTWVFAAAVVITIAIGRSGPRPASTA
ncbi:MAG: DMT family transporter [Burkholderiaceae bacterium]